MSTARLLLFTASALAGCAETCPPPQAALDGKSWEVFGRVITLDQEPAPEWPAETLPFNGPHTWMISWLTNSLQSPITVTIDDQVFDGNGVYDDVECGNFSVAFKGTYVGADASPPGLPSEHLFGASARLILFDDTLDGFLDFQSSWVSADEDQGTAAGTVQLSAADEAVASTP